MSRIGRRVFIRREIQRTCQVRYSRQRPFNGDRLGGRQYLGYEECGMDYSIVKAHGCRESINAFLGQVKHWVTGQGYYTSSLYVI